MKLSDYKQEYYFLSGSASAVSRQLAFASIAAIWIFSSHTGSSYALPYFLIMSATLIIIGLTLDLLQYVFSSLIWGYFHRHHEKHSVTKDNKDPELDAPEWFNWPSIFCFWFKLLFIVSGNAYLIYFLIKNVLITT